MYDINSHPECFEGREAARTMDSFDACERVRLDYMSETALQIITHPNEDGYALALSNAIRIWAESTTGLHSYNRAALIGDKKAAVNAFFNPLGKSPAEADVLDVQAWRDRMQKQALKPNTIYARISRLASFFEWLR